MKFLANENFPFPSIKLLRNSDFHVESVMESFPGISDQMVIETAKRNRLIIITFDKDYGEIIFKHGINNPPSVIFFRSKGSGPEAAGKILIRLIKNKNLTFENKFTVIEEDNVRQRNY
jgi:predicted nuclease of predicted toxin-antitoxin system